MNKERQWNDIKVIVSGETYEKYKGTLQEQIEDLQQRIDKAIEYIKENINFRESVRYSKKIITILLGEDNEQ